PPSSTPFPYTTLFRSPAVALEFGAAAHRADHVGAGARLAHRQRAFPLTAAQLWQVLLALGLVAVGVQVRHAEVGVRAVTQADRRSEEHTSELQSRENL